jgi:uncharacterized membrane protein HdeD (DUF308 family)
VSYEVDETRSVADRLNGPSGARSAASAVFPFLVQIAKYWWVELLVGVLWLVLAVVVLKFNHASVITVGIVTGILFLAFAVEELVLAAVAPRARWLWALFAVLLTAAGILALINPTDTFTAFADILGFVFLLIGIVWLVHAFAERAFNELWWLGLVSGILMVILAFWVSGEFFLDRADTLLVFAGIWAIMKGITDIIRAFQIRKLVGS